MRALHDSTYYDAQSPSGLCWAKDPDAPGWWNRDFEGKPCGTRIGNGTFRLKVGNRKLMCHHAVWELHHGPIPKGKTVEFIDKNSKSHAITNLRLVEIGHRPSSGPPKFYFKDGWFCMRRKTGLVSA